ncbi:thiopurine S-methyltransferase [Rhodohalobacter sp. 614A]|uniref:thiopurine S-methyltransferase n=1 Tax=Rhodohalobacter sp. 614A TaxID=2908649 RepID=UPI001F016CDC|nr:thiopurine S-methyltransferase [Rhodohalobacter sp. 614A]
MELSYWQSKWRKGKTGFHMEEGYPGLATHWKSLGLDHPVVLVPLCGKSKDLLFLAEHCEKVVGVEISELAVHQFLKENKLEANITSFANFSIYKTGNIEIWQGDFFKLPGHKFPPFDLVYDKAAMIALPPDMRRTYVSKVLELVSVHTQILLHLFDYPQEEMTGPPFSVPVTEVKDYFGKHFTIDILERNELGINYYKKFQNRGLNSYFIEILSLLLPKEG